MTATAIAAGIAGLFLPIVFPRADRRRLLPGLTAVAVISNVLVAPAPNLAVLLRSRVLVGFAIGGFWAMAIAVSVHLVSFGKLGRAMTIINVRMSLATIAAVPPDTWLGQAWGWRGVFFLSAGAAVLAIIIQAATLPHVPATRGGGFAPSEPRSPLFSS